MAALGNTAAETELANDEIGGGTSWPFPLQLSFVCLCARTRECRCLWRPEANFGCLPQLLNKFFIFMSVYEPRVCVWGGAVETRRGR